MNHQPSLDRSTHHLDTNLAQPILVTGAAGFIGARVATMLLAQGIPVVGVDNLNDAYDVRLKHWRLAQIKDHPNFTFHRLDIADRGALCALFDQQLTTNAPISHRALNPFSAVINLAARAGVRQSVANPWVYVDTNVTGTLNLLELCREFGVKKFVLASTSSLYSGNPTMPYREDLPTDQPLSPYAASKKAAEALCYTYHALYGMDMVVLRYFTVYGPGGRPDMSLFRFVQRISEDRPVTIYGDGSQSRDFTYVDDIARGTIAAVFYLKSTDERLPIKNQRPTRSSSGGSRSSIFEIINLGSDTPVVLMDAVHLVEELVGKKARIEYRPRHPADVMATWADISKAEQILGWRPRVSFQEGVARLVQWYQENQGWAKEIVTI